MNVKPMSSSREAAILRAACFAADKHRDQRRRGREATPYINHPIAVAEILTRVGGVTDLAPIQAALLHDTIEDTDTSADELRKDFADEVTGLVLEITDDKRLDKADRKRLQVEHSPHLSANAKMIKMADKIANVTDVLYDPPVHWDDARRLAYFDWSTRVVDGCRDANAHLATHFDELVSRARVAVSHG